MNNVTVEWAPFTLKEGVDESKLLEAAETLQKEFLSKQEGFLKRELLKGKANRWADILHWNTKEAAEKAMGNAMNSSVCHSYFQFMADATEMPSTFEQIKIWN